MNTSLINKGKLVHSIDYRIKKGEYKNYPAVKNKLNKIKTEISNGLTKLSNDDYWLLVMEEYIICSS